MSESLFPFFSSGGGRRRSARPKPSTLNQCVRRRRLGRRLAVPLISNTKTSQSTYVPCAFWRKLLNLAPDRAKVGAPNCLFPGGLVYDWDTRGCIILVELEVLTRSRFHPSYLESMVCISSNLVCWSMFCSTPPTQRRGEHFIKLAIQTSIAILLFSSRLCCSRL